ncbi:MAG: hypothetical protein ACJAWV_000439 [Flammeovirgaceae bacterium]|jgi:hypothetical protein
MNDFKNGVEYLNKLRMLFYILMGIPLTFFSVLFFMEKQDGITPLLEFDNLGTLRLVLAIGCIGCASFAYIQYNRKLREVRTLTTLREKLSAHWSLNMMKYALMEVSCLVPLTFFFLTADIFFKGLYVLMMVAMAISNPTIYTLLSDLRPRKAEGQILKTNQEIE